MLCSREIDFGKVTQSECTGFLPVCCRNQFVLGILPRPQRFLSGRRHNIIMMTSSAFLDLVFFIPLHHPAALVVSLVLLCFSATFSSCETALFSLTPPELNRIRSSNKSIDRVILALYRELNTLLPSLLFCNMAVNVLLYSLVAVIGTSFGETFGTAAAFGYGLFSLGLVIFFGEVFPKQVAIAAAVFVAKVTAVPVWLCYRGLAKPMSVLNAVVRACERIVDVRRRDYSQLREEEFKMLMDFSKTDGVISADEYELIDGIVDLPDVKIRDLMTPRVDVVMVKPDTTCKAALDLARLCSYVKLPVIDPAKDVIMGWIDVRDIFVKSEAGTVKNHLRRFKFFSEHDRADQVLAKINSKELMAVVDERGFIVGFFTLQDIMDEILGHFGDYGNAPPEKIRERDGNYLLSGTVSVREWRELFNVSARTPRSSTVGGLVLALLGRPAKRGDKVRLDNLEMTVMSVWQNRVTEVMARLAPPSESSGKEQE